MNLISLTEFCKSVFDLLDIPMIIYHKETGKIVSGFFADASFSEFMINDPSIASRYMGGNLFTTEHTVSFYISDDKIAFGSVLDRDSTYAVYIGPCLLSDPTESMMHSMLTRSNSPFRNNPGKYYDTLYRYIRTLPRFTPARFLWVLGFCCNSINHEVKDPEDFYQAAVPKNRIDPKEERDINRVEVDRSRLITQYDRTVRELQMLIRNGSVTAVNAFWNDNASVFSRILSALRTEDEPLRSAKNRFICFVSAVSAEACDAGISVKQAHELEESLISEVENCLIPQQTEPFFRKATLSFTELMQRLLTDSRSGNELIRQAVNYIHDHISEPLSASEIAEALGYSRGYLSAQFKKEMSIKISDYVNREKIAVAESLLIDTENSIVDISNYLSFSSQNYFQNVFRKVTSTTPLKYRQNYFRKSDPDKDGLPR